jgi:DNA-binding transcriptional regulator/RsmH inhibitor MraZ
MSPTGRVSVPAAWLRRNDLSRGLVLCRDFGAIGVRTFDAYERLLEELLTDEIPWARMLRRQHAASACEAQADSKGRSSIPGVLREYAGLESDIVWLEFADCVRLCSPSVWIEIRDRPVVCSNRRVVPRMKEPECGARSAGGTCRGRSVPVDRLLGRIVRLANRGLARDCSLGCRMAALVACVPGRWSLFAD